MKLTLLTAAAVVLTAVTAAPDAALAAETDPKKEEAPVAAETTVTTPSGLKYVDLVTGDGVEATKDAFVEVHYTGWLENGTKFDSSLDRGRPFGFILGAGRVIQGWDEGVVGMRVGGRRKLIIPPSIGYGERGAGGVIPPNATLVFEVDLIKVN